jgi:ATP-dependent DNA helicase RecQ
MRERLLEALRQGFGHSSFRPGQEEMIERVMAGRNVLGLLATGGGKSITYQLPSLLLPGLVVVVSPLISLMVDQVQKLRARRVIPAAYVNSTMDPGEIKQLMSDMSRGKYRLLYISPEKLQQPSVQKVLAVRGVSLIAIDEAHCISQWGHDFRTDYMRLPDVIARLGHPTVLAVTATATPAVREEICQLLAIAPDDVVTQPLNRRNIAIDVIPVLSEAERRERVIEAMDSLKGPGIVYCGTRQAVETLAEQYRLTGQKRVHAYHGGMNGMERALIQQQFLRNELDVIVATNAFGMGIDKPDIRFVLHYHFPASLEAYAQEIGRIGRDGSPGYACLYYAQEDVHIHTHLLEKEYPTEVQAEHFLEGLRQGKLAYADLLSSADIGEEMAQLLIFYAEQAGVISEVAVTREGYTFSYVSEHANEPLSVMRILERTERAKRQKQEKLRHMLHWLHSAECLRIGLARYYGETGEVDYLQACCTRCGFERSLFEQIGGEHVPEEKKEWDLEQALRKLLPKKKDGKERKVKRVTPTRST